MRAYSTTDAGEACRAVTDTVWREIVVGTGTGTRSEQADVVDWPVSEICPLPNDTLFNLTQDGTFDGLWVDFVVADQGGGQGAVRYRFTPMPDDGSGGGSDPATIFCEWINCSSAAGGAVCRVLQCN